MRDAKTNPPLRAVYLELYKLWGPQKWWPADSPFEMIAGAILTQNTSWSNVEKAINNLKRHRALSVEGMHQLSTGQLARLIRSAGTFRVKAVRLKNFTNWVMANHAGDLDAMFKQPPDKLRDALLGINGIGKETADCILLYAGDQPYFVVDTYTRRVLSRHNWIAPDRPYDDIASMFERTWRKYPKKRRTEIYNEFHALIVKLAKDHCRIRPDCGECPLRKWLPKQQRPALPKQKKLTQRR